MLISAAFFILIVCLLLKFLPDESRLRYYFCYIIFYLSYLVIITLLIPIFCLRPVNAKNMKYGKYAGIIATKLMGVNWDIRNSELVEGHKKGIVVLNHQSVFDAIAYSMIWETVSVCTIVGRKEVFYVAPFGFGSWLAGLLIINRNNPKQAMKKLQEAASKFFKNQENGKILFFPEGTRNRGNDGLFPFKKGAFKIAIENQVPILPVVVAPYYLIKPRQYFKRGTIPISFLTPIPTRGMTMNDLDKLTEKTRFVMINEFNKLSSEVGVPIKN